MAKRWKAYQDYLLKGDWHVHTSFTDGLSTVWEHCRAAEDKGLKLVAFMEHVRWKLTYDFGSLVEEIHRARERFQLQILVGCEAKVVDLDGNLDVRQDVLHQCDIVMGVFHSFLVETREGYLKALENMLCNEEVDIWGHPGLFAKRKGVELRKEDIERVVELCWGHEVLVERNRKYSCPDWDAWEGLRACPFVCGSDAHTAHEILGLEELACLMC